MGLLWNCERSLNENAFEEIDIELSAETFEDEDSRIDRIYGYYQLSFMLKEHRSTLVGERTGR